MSSFFVRSLFSCVFLCTILVLSACHKTPEKQAIASQDSLFSQTQQTSDDTVMSPSSKDTPFRVPENITRDPKEISHLSLTIDADVSAPSASGFEAVSVARDNFSENRIIDIVKLLSESEDIKLLGDYQPTAAYWENLLAQLIESGVHDDTREEYISNRTETAPEEEIRVPLDYGSLSTEVIGEAWAEKPDGTVAYLIIGNNLNNFQFTRSQETGVIPDSATAPEDNEEDKPGNPSISKEDAERTAASFVDQIGADLDFLDAEPALIKENGVPTETGWMCTFSRSVGGLQKLERAGGAYINPDALPSRVSPWGPEMLRITVDSHGIVQATWFGAARTEDTLESSVQLLPFEELLEKVVSQLGYIYGPQTNENGVGRDVTVTRFSLGEEMIAVPENPDMAMYIPVWTVDVEEKWADLEDSAKRSYVFTAAEGTYVEPNITTREYLEITQ